VCSATKQDALDNATRAAELYMKAMQLASTREEKTRLKGKCMAAFSRAEQIKKTEQWPLPGISNQSKSSPTQAGCLQAPTSKRELSTQEKLVVLKSSKLHGTEFPPWTREPSHEEFAPSREPYL